MIIWEKSEFGNKFKTEKGRNRFTAFFELDGLATNLDDSKAMMEQVMTAYIDMCKELMMDGKRSDGSKYPTRDPNEKMPNSEFPRRVTVQEYVDWTNNAITGGVDVKKSSGTSRRKRVKSWVLKRWIKRAKKKYTFRGKVFELKVRPRPMISGLAYEGIKLNKPWGKGTKGKIIISVPKQRMAYFRSQRPLDLRDKPLQEFEQAFKDYLEMTIFIHKRKSNKVVAANGQTVMMSRYLNDKLLQAVLKNLKRRIARKAKALALASL